MKKTYIAPNMSCLHVSAQPFMSLSDENLHIGGGSSDGEGGSIGTEDAFAPEWRSALDGEEW